MKNFKKLFLAGAVVWSMGACSEEEVLNTQGSDKGEAYMSLSIEMPNLGTSTRSANLEGDGVDAGTVDEQTISKIDIWVYDENGTNPQKQSFTGDQLKPQAPNPIAPNATTTYTLPPFAVTQGVKKIVVLVNPLTTKFSTALANVKKMGEFMELGEEEIKQASAAKNFMMINANKTANGDGLATLTVTAENNKNNPAVVTVEVERVVAKIEERTLSYEIAVGKTGDKVVFNEVALINGNKKFFPIKKVEARDMEQYVVDPNFENQTTTTDFYATTYPNTYAKALTNKEVNAAGPVFYTLENTMIKGEQKNAYTTGLYYKATYYLKDNTNKTKQNVYQYAGVLYNFDQLKQAAPELGLNLTIPGEGALVTELTDTSSQADFDKIGVKKYEDGVCYYPYWIRHIDNNKPNEMGAMEFAVVRNNYYQMTINSVKGIGEYKPTTPDASTPDELVETYLDVKVKVLPWIVRKNNIDF